MVKSDSWSESIDDFSDIKALAKQENTPIINSKADAAQSLQSAMTDDAILSSQPFTIQKTSLSAPLIYEDIWGDDVEEPCVTATSFSPDQMLNADMELIKKWTKDEEPDDDILVLSENSNEISVSSVASLYAAHGNATDFLTKF